MLSAGLREGLVTDVAAGVTAEASVEAWVEAGVDTEPDGDAECGKEQARSLTVQLLHEGRASSHLMWRRLHSQQPLRDLRCARRSLAVFVLLALEVVVLDESGRVPGPGPEPSGPEERGDMGGSL